MTAALVLSGCSADDASEDEPVPAQSIAPVPSEFTEQSDLAERAEAEAGQGSGDAGTSRDRPDGAPVLGADFSWPQCPKGMGIPQKQGRGAEAAPPPLPNAEYIVVGLTNGPGFFPNPCLEDQVAFMREADALLGAYAVASFPRPAEIERYREAGPFDAGTSLGELRNVGYAQAEFNIATMRAAGLDAPVVWIDVEPVPDFEWSGDPAANAAIVEGLARGYRDAGLGIGVYSTTFLWQQVVGGFQLGVPEWRAAGQTSAEQALAQCSPEKAIQGGEPVMGQWVEVDRDMNLTCPGISRDLGRWFAEP